MLCDDLVADGALPDIYDGIGKMRDKLRAAQKFILAKEFAVAADGLVGNKAELVKILPWCRLPYPTTWIEFLNDDRPHWHPSSGLARPVDPERHQGEPQRIGFLAEQVERASRWRVHLFWSFKNPPTGTYSKFNASLTSFVFDAETPLNDCDDPLERCTNGDVADFGHKMLFELSKKQPDIVKTLMEYSVEDWGGEGRFLIAALGLLNTRNVVERQPVEQAAENVRRAKHGKRALFSYSLLKVRPAFKPPAGERGQGSGDHRDTRMHFVRGHIKRRKSGIYWWSHHARGKAEHGVVVKDYELIE